MAVKIRLRRIGAKKAPYYDPTTEPTTLKVDAEKAQKWVSTGAQPTDTVKALFKKNGIL